MMLVEPHKTKKTTKMAKKEPQTKCGPQANDNPEGTGDSNAHSIINAALAEEFGVESIHWTQSSIADWYRWKLAKGYRFIGIADGKLHVKRGIPWSLNDTNVYLCDLADPNLLEHLKKELQDESHLQFKD
jgi:hypothetical protein